MLRRVAMAVVLVGLYSASVFTTNGCGTGGVVTDPPIETVLVGLVTAADTGFPLRAADVSIQGGSKQTEPNGTYSIGGLVPGQSKLTVSRDGYVTFETTITLREGVNTRDVQLVRR